MNNSLKAAVSSLFVLGGAALLAVALRPVTVPSAPAPSGDVSLGHVTVVEELPGPVATVLPEVLVVARTFGPARNEPVIAHVARVAESAVVIRPATPVEHYVFDVDVQL